MTFGRQENLPGKSGSERNGVYPGLTDEMIDYMIEMFGLFFDGIVRTRHAALATTTV